MRRNGIAVATCVLLLVHGVTAPVFAQQLPTGGSVAAGSANINQSGATLNVNQSTNQAIINWQSFSVGQGGTVNFNQPSSSSSTLNRVLGTTPSTIAGTINAPGTVLLVNPNGIAITSTGVVNVGGFAASTLNIKDEDYLAGKYRFTGNGGSAAVSNAGRINVSDGGFAALLGGQVSNSGVISARLGKVGLGAGELITLDFAGDGFLSVAVPSSQVGNLVDPNGALVTNSGKIRANGGQVFLSAATAANILRDAVNVPGSIRANSVGSRGGKIIIGGGAGGKVNVTGKLAARGGKRNAGGTVEVSGAEVNLAGAVNVGGKTGGTITAKGDRKLAVSGIIAAKGVERGGKVDLTGGDVYIADGLIDTSALGNVGTGGTITVIASGTADVLGTFRAEGGEGGRGGFIETSGAHLHVADSTTVSTLAKNGVAGKWLIDPPDFVVAASGGDMSNATLSANLNSTDIELKSANGANGVNGDIFINGTVSWTENHTLTLTAVRDINFNADVTATGTTAGLVMNYGGDYSIADGKSVTLSGANATLSINGTSYTLVRDTAGLQAINSGLGGNYALATSFTVGNTTPIGSYASPFTGTFAGLGHTLSSLTVDVGTSGGGAGLFGVSSGTLRDTILSGGTVSGAYDVGALVGRNLGGTVTNAGAIGVTVTGTTNGPVYSVGGLIGLNTGTVRQSYATGNVIISGDGTDLGTGGLVGYNTGLIEQSYATGTVTSTGNAVGGLVGGNEGGTIQTSNATGNVTGRWHVGGLIGENIANTDDPQNPIGSVVSQSWAGGAVTATAIDNGIGTAGGLIGFNSQSSITDSYATGAVFGWNAGGLVGQSYLGSIARTYATGSVTQNPAGTVDGSQGGLVGKNFSDGTTITSSFWDTSTSNQAAGVGAGGSQTGVTGLTSANAFVMATYSGAGFGVGAITSSNTWIMIDGQTRPFLLSEYSTTITNAHQLQLMAHNLAASYTLANNIDASETSGSNPAGMWSAAGFVPIGNFATPFTGTLDGQGYAVSSLTIDRPSANYVGLIGYMNSSARVSNIGLSGGSVSGNWDVGALIGDNSGGTVQQSYATGTVSGVTYVGGLVGSNYGTVQQSYAAGAVSGSGNQAGGLVGYNSFGGTVRQSYATGTVSGNSTVGGLVGDNGGTVQQSYATGAVNGTSAVGGLAGSNSGTLQQSYAAGAVSASSFYVGGLVGYNSGAVTYSYWDTQTSGRLTGIGGGTTTGATGLTTAQMMDGVNYRTIFAGFDFDAVWAPAGNGYRPELYGVSGVVGVQATDATMVYGDAVPALGSPTYLGLGAWNTLIAAATLSTNATSTSNVGTYAITGSGATATFTGGGASRIVYLSSDLSVTARPLVVTANAQSRAYGDTNPATGGASGNNLVNGDTIASVSLSSPATAASNVGSYDLTGSAAVFGTGQASNYAITYATRTNGLSVTARPITVTADAQSRAYGDANPALTYQITSGNLVNNDTLSGVQATTADTTSGVGTYGIARNTLSASSNYALTYVGANLTVTPRAITVTADAKSRTYGDANPGLTYQITSGNLVNNDTLSGVLATAADGTSNVGTYGITQNTLTAGGNYALTYVGANLTVTPRAITVTADAKSRTYGDANPGLTYQITSGNLVNNDTLSGVLATAADGTSNVGTYGITQNTLSGGNNYALTYVGANLTVTPRAITVTADAQSKTYGDANPALTYQVTSGNLVNNDVLSGALTTMADGTSNVGNYAITQNTLSGGNNYALTYVGANLTVTPRAITVTADAQSRTYGDANPALTYQITSGNLVNNDTLSGVLATVADTTSGVGTYGITQNTLAASNNYALSYVGANLTVTPRPITVTADTQSRAYGDANPGLTYQITSGNLVNNDTLSGVLATVANTTSGVGTYGITQNTLSGGNNYALTYVGANLTVTPRAITVTADAKSRAYGDANPGLTHQITSGNLVNNDTLSGVLATAADGTSNVGTYGITQNTLAASSNYALTYVGANLTVTPRAITVTADAQSRTYGDANPALTYQITSGNLVNNDTLSGVLATLADANSPAGVYAITQNTLAASSNYALTYIGAGLTVTPITSAPGGSGSSSGNNPSTFNPQTPTTPQQTVSIMFQNQDARVFNISFTPPNIRSANTNTPVNDVVTASPRSHGAPADNNGRSYLPISQFDANQYSDFKLPDFAKNAGEAAIFVMLARAADLDNASNYMIDKFWNGSASAWNAPAGLAEKVSFTDGAGNAIAPIGGAGSPIVPGTTDIAGLLKAGPIIISGGQPARSLLAIAVSADGKGIVANDPASGKRVLFAYDAATKTVGGIVGVFNGGRLNPVASTDTGNQALTALQGFNATAFIAVTVR